MNIRIPFVVIALLVSMTVMGNLAEIEPSVSGHGSNLEHQQNVNKRSEEPMLFIEDDFVLDEYEQHVCDQVQAPKPSRLVAFFTNVGCSVLVHYIAFTVKAKRMISKAKNTVTQWINKQF